MSAADLNALLRGELPRTDEERRLAGLIDALRADPPRAPERLRARVGELRPAPRRLSSFAPRRLLLVAAPAAVALALGAAIVHGLADSGAPQKTPVAQQRAASATTPSEDKARLAPSAAPSHSAGGGATWAQAQRSQSPAQTELRKVPGAIAAGPRLTRYEASLRVRVADTGRLADATSAATRVARSLGGYAASVQYRTPSGRPGEADLELRIPTDRVQAALTRLSALGTLISERIFVQDVQGRVERQTSQIVQLREEITLTIAALKNPALSPVDRIRLQLRLNEAKRALAQRLHARKGTIAEGTLARVSLVLTSKQQAAAAHHRSRIDRMLGSAVSFLGLEATILLYALIVVSPLLPLAALAWGLAWARRR